MKRAFDLFVTLAAAPFWLPLLAGTALAVRVAMGRPVLFRQERAGRFGKPFALLKFRTMRDGDAPDAARLTRFGSFLRRTSLDELPQLLHVLAGTMSLVGPRPLPVRYLPRYTPEQARRHDVPPGITGLAQVRGRNALSWEEKFRYDVAYAAHPTLAADLRILFETFRAVVRPRGISAAGEATMPEFTGTRP